MMTRATLRSNIGRLHFLLTLLSISLSACSDSTGPEKVEPYFLEYGGQSGSFSDLLSDDEKKDLIGIIHLEYTKHNTLEPDPPREHYLFTGSSSYGNLRFADVQGLPSDIDSALINGTAFLRADQGWYNNDGVPLRFGSSPNRLHIALGKNKSRIEDSFFLAAQPIITNLDAGQEISRSDSIRIKWNGANQNPASFSIVVREPEEDPIGVGHAVGWRAMNTGSSAFKPFPAQLKKGLADIYLAQFEKKILQLSDGKKICLLLESKFVVSVRIVD